MIDVLVSVGHGLLLAAPSLVRFGSRLLGRKSGAAPAPTTANAPGLSTGRSGETTKNAPGTGYDFTPPDSAGASLMSYAVSSGGPGDSSGGLLLDAVMNPATLTSIVQGITWVDVQCPSLDLIVTVGLDALRCEVDGRMLRMPVSYNEQVRICQALGCISPLKEMVDDIWASAKHIAVFGLNVTPGTAYDQHLDLLKSHVESSGKPWAQQNLGLLMSSVVMAQQLNANVDREIEARGYDQGTDLVRSLGKNWIIDPAMVRNGAANYAWFNEAGVGLQGKFPGGVHNAEHSDYSQLFCDCPKLAARRISDGSTVDLREFYLAKYPALRDYIGAYQ